MTTAATPCADRSHAPRLFGTQWVCPDCEPFLPCIEPGCDNALPTAHHAKLLLRPSRWNCGEHDDD